MADIHGFLARVTLALVLVTAAWSLVLLATRRPLRPSLVGGLVWVVGLLGLTSLLGVLVWATTHPPKDLLHLVYGVLAISVLPGAWALGRSRPDARRQVLVLAVASIVLAILVLRLFQTGG